MSKRKDHHKLFATAEIGGLSHSIYRDPNNRSDSVVEIHKGDEVISSMTGGEHKASAAFIENCLDSDEAPTDAQLASLFASFGVEASKAN